jgi:hypothetical protein
VSGRNFDLGRLNAQRYIRGTRRNAKANLILCTQEVRSQDAGYKHAPTDARLASGPWNRESDIFIPPYDAVQIQELVNFSGRHGFEEFPAALD